MLHMERRKLAVSVYTNPFSHSRRSLEYSKHSWKRSTKPVLIDRRRSSGANRRKIAGTQQLPESARSANKPRLKKSKSGIRIGKNAHRFKRLCCSGYPIFPSRHKCDELRRYYAQGHDESVWRTDDCPKLLICPYLGCCMWATHYSPAVMMKSLRKRGLRRSKWMGLLKPRKLSKISGDALILITGIGQNAPPFRGGVLCVSSYFLTLRP